MNHARAHAPTLKHLAFFEALAELREESAEACAATAGLLPLRLIDHWILGGSALVEPESVSVRSVRKALMSMESIDPVREILLGLVNTMQTLRDVDMTPILPRVFAYGTLLERRAEFPLAADVYRTIARLASEQYDGDLLLDTYMRLGHCQRVLSLWDAADSTFVEAGRLAARRREPAKAMISRIGLADVAYYRGNVPKAEELFSAIISDCQAAGFTAERARALHSSAAVESVRGRHDRAVCQAFDALQLTTSEIRRERILADLGAFLIRMERFDAARDALLVLEAVAATQEVRLHARVNLLVLAARIGDRNLFFGSRAALANVELPPSVYVNVMIESARGLRRFGAPEQASELLIEAQQFAEENELNGSIFEIEAMMNEDKTLVEATRDKIPASAPDPVAHVASGLRLMAAALDR